ncbi:hypothetical protein SAMN04488515_2682 [Cognatiyoonia koreensis]|uniref:Uncharacterized protein n=1 Tax=Cognatiyoonia koreensis TaxID=364200 RepID=A0A1I0RH70_9RHOB|nr:hypothetical protein SAMN04488515_2682 [Cognatiyoonia koreensis]
MFADPTSVCNFLVQKLNKENNIWGYPQVSPQESRWISVTKT